MEREDPPQVGRWHLLEPEEVLAQLSVNPERGLTDTEVQQRKDKYGLNELSGETGEYGTEKPIVVPWKRPMIPAIVFLLIMAVALVLIDTPQSALPVLMIVGLHILFVIVQIYRTEQAVIALKARIATKSLAPSRVRVRRDGQLRRILRRELVPGDILILQTGNTVAADGRLLEVVNLCIQEASLTGESCPVDKTTHVVEGENVFLGARRNMVYMGTTVTCGCGIAVVVATGMYTEQGRVTAMTLVF